MLTPMLESNTLKCGKLITDEDVYIGYNDDCEQFIEIYGCPRIYLGMVMDCKNLEENRYEVLGELIDLQYDECSGYLFVFK
jgi:hypothetical protein